MIPDFQFIVIPFLACILLLLLTSYFGIHVLKREIIFIDIAIAQIAVLGGVAVIFLEHALLDQEGKIAGISLPGETLAYIFSLLFCLGAAVLFTVLKNPKIKVPLEAFIGIAYAFATMAAVIILDKGAGGDVHLHEMMTGTILWTTRTQMMRLAIIVLIIGGFQLIFREKFIRLSMIYGNGPGNLKSRKWWDFLFYLSFSILVIEAVRIAGVLTVFAFLILPASISALFAEGWLRRILIGLASGILASAAGLYLSIYFDMAASPLIILSFGMILLLGVMVKGLAGKKMPS
jgi:zinc/manganese transport system permease protein